MALNLPNCQKVETARSQNAIYSVLQTVFFTEHLLNLAKIEKAGNNHIKKLNFIKIDD